LSTVGFLKYFVDNFILYDSVQVSLLITQLWINYVVI